LGRKVIKKGGHEKEVSRKLQILERRKKEEINTNVESGKKT